ncbi:MAG: hypothetical protein F6K14_31380 [Symploca sp. SIO2C1]|nr:hypothetical protein [Symploca sp. SIO2C1]
MTIQFGKMTVELRNSKPITGPGNLTSDVSQEYFDYTDKPYPSSIDWKQATTLTFKPDQGKEKTYLASETKYYFNAGWVGPRLVFRE